MGDKIPNKIRIVRNIEMITAGDECIPQLRAKITSGSGVSNEKLCSLNVFNLRRAVISA